ncbi:EAL domain-containing protein [Pengzhenrongella phosphoraccumulans]|uniref:sensor domain-containing protein n=1 Tax=Pengzhenrongella phosphoraccumulans TaxID=3114394 RepID=UPI00388F1826
MSTPDGDEGARSPGVASGVELRSALAALPDPVFIMKAVRAADGSVVELMYTYVNDAVARLYGLPVEAVLGHGLVELFPSVKELGLFDAEVGVIESGLPVVFDVPWFQENGVEGSFSLTASRFGDGLLVSARDVTQQRQAEAELRASSWHDQLLAQNTSDVVVLSDPDRQVTWVSPAVTSVLGWAPADLVGTVFDDLIHPDDHEPSINKRVRIDSSLEPPASAGALVVRMRTVAGGYRWMSAAATALTDDAGNPVGVATALRDVDELVRAEERAAADRARLRAIVDSMLDPQVLLAAVRDEVGRIVDFRYVDANPAACENSHLDHDRLVGMRVLELLPGQEGLNLMELYRQVLETGDPLILDNVVYPLAREGGAERHHDLRGVRAGDELSITWRDATERDAAARALALSEANLARLAMHDPLTGLLNRRGFEAELDRKAGEVARYGPSGALIMLDLDHFKEVNDTLGHLTGDELIASIARVLNRSVRGTDVVARLGGDEFAVILPHADRQEAQAAAEKILRAVRNQVTVLSGSHRRVVTTSAGVAMFDDPGLSGEGVLLNADVALYAAKGAGRNRSSFYDGAVPKQPPTKTRLDWVERINVALEKDRFELHAQPVLDLHTGQVSRYELLLRMLDDNGATIGPDEFLHTAERTGLIARIDRWVTGQAIDLLTHPDLSPETVLEVNISGLSVGDADLLTFLEEQFRQTGADPSRLVFEITETAAIGNVPAARTFAERLTDIGCQFALDDFGSGFGSFYDLKHLHFDYIKIDGEFIANCIANQTDQLVIQALVTIAHGLNKQTVAEFVGDENTLRFVADQGIDFAQGYHIGRPDVLDNLIRGNGHGTSPDWVRT